MIKYQLPQRWIAYDAHAVINELVGAKSAVLSLRAVPFQKRWADEMQKMQLKLEVAGTSKIEGADFTGNELDQALKETPEQLLTRSQRQAHAAMNTYRWIAQLGGDAPVTEALIKDVHRRIITGADDDHCPPGQLRTRDQNVTFGSPPHRGCDGGPDCAEAFSQLVEALQHEYQAHDLLVQALALHYHIAAMHPFLDGNGRTARALEALFLQRAGLRDTLFIAMSNYYYDEKKNYLEALAAVRTANGDLTPFLKFGLRGIELQSNRLLELLRKHLKKELFRNLTHDLFTRLRTPRKRVIAKRQISLVEALLAAEGETELEALIKATAGHYGEVSSPRKAIIRDLNGLIALGAVDWHREKEGDTSSAILLYPMLDWPSEITESKFFDTIRKLPKSKPMSFLSPLQ